MQPLCPQGWGAGAQPGTFHALCEQEMGCSLRALWCLCSQCSQCSPCSQQPALPSFVVASRSDVKPWHQLCLPMGAGHPTGPHPGRAAAEGEPRLRTPEHRAGQHGHLQLAVGPEQRLLPGFRPSGCPRGPALGMVCVLGPEHPPGCHHSVTSRLPSPSSVGGGASPTRALMHRALRRGGEP